jgi:hypothetical protein
MYTKSRSREWKRHHDDDKKRLEVMAMTKVGDAGEQRWQLDVDGSAGGHEQDVDAGILSC